MVVWVSFTFKLGHPKKARVYHHLTWRTPNSWDWMDWSQPVSGEDLEGSDSLQILLDDDLDFFLGCWVLGGVGGWVGGWWVYRKYKMYDMFVAFVAFIYIYIYILFFYQQQHMNETRFLFFEKKKWFGNPIFKVSWEVRSHETTPWAADHF